MVLSFEMTEADAAKRPAEDRQGHGAIFNFGACVELTFILFYPTTWG